MADEQKDQPRANLPPTLPVPRALIYGVGAIVVGSFLLTQFVHNPYLAATQMDGYERSPFDGVGLWAAIFLGIPGLWFTWTKIIAPMLKKG